MENELNQVQDTQEEGLFDDLVQEETQEVVNETDESTPAEEVKEQPQEESFLDIDYLKEVKHLSKDEAKTLAQKGMDYDRIKEKYESFKPYDNTIKSLERLAKQNGMNVNDFVNNLSSMQNEFETNKKLKELIDENPDTDRAILERLARAEISQTIFENQTKEDPQKVELQRQVTEFEKEYPDVNWGELPDEVVDYMNSGMTLLAAYQKYDRSNMKKQIEELQSKVAIKTKNDTNKNKSLGNLSSSDEEGGDDFLSGFMNA